MDTSFADPEYGFDADLIVEDDAHRLERLAPLMQQMLDADDELGAVIKRKSALIKRMPDGANLFQQFANNARRKTTVRKHFAKLFERQPQRKAACEHLSASRRSRVSRKDLVGRSQTPSPIFAVLDFKVGALSTSIKAMSGQNIRMVKAFHKGLDDDGAPYGSETPIDSHRTNLITGGAMPDGSTFLCHGVDVDITALDRSEMNAADLRVFGEAQLRWSVGNGAQSVQLTRAAECPPTRGVVTAAGGGDELGVRFTGTPFRSQTPLFSLRAGEKGHEMQIEFPDPSIELVKACRVRVILVGRHFQRMAGR